MRLWFIALTTISMLFVLTAGLAHNHIPHSHNDITQSQSIETSDAAPDDCTDAACKTCAFAHCAHIGLPHSTAKTAMPTTHYKISFTNQDITPDPVYGLIRPPRS